MRITCSWLYKKECMGLIGHKSLRQILDINYFEHLHLLRSSALKLQGTT